MEAIQTFKKGMIQDFTDQPQDSFLDGMGFQLISNRNNTWAIETSKGNLFSFQVTRNYRIIGVMKDVNQIIVHSAYNGPLAQTNGEIAIVTINSLNNNSGTYLPIYNHQKLNYLLSKQIEGYTFPENDRIKRAYWSDFNNEPRVINYADARFKTYIGTAALIPGKQYMVVQGEVLHNGLNYGPNDILGTVFTAQSPVYVALQPSLVIEYVPYETLSWVPRFLLSRIRPKQWIVGNLPYGAWQYSYQLQTVDGAVTPWSPLTLPFNIGTLNPTNSILSYQDIQGHSTNSNSSMGIRLTVENIDPIYSRIRVAAIRNTALDVADTPGIIYDGAITGSTMDIDHQSGEFLLPLLIDDLVTSYTNIKKVRTLASTNNIGFIANIETQQEFTFKPSVSAKIKVCKYDMLSDIVQARDLPAATLPLNGHPIATDGVLTGSVRGLQWYKVFGAPGESITYNGSVYLPNQSFQGVFSIRNFTKTGNPVLRAIIRIQKYTGVYDEIPILNDFYDHKSYIVSCYLKSRFRGEVERIGIVPFDTAGNPLPVRWIGDKTIPSRYHTIDPDTNLPIGFDMNIGFSNGTMDGSGEYYLRSIGLTIDNLNLKEITDSLGLPLSALPTVISGFAIVCAKRDKQVITQGIIYSTIINGTTLKPQTANKYGFDSHFSSGGQRRKNIYCMYSPENNTSFNGEPRSFIDSDELELVDYLDDQLSITGDGYADTPNYHFTNKFYNSVNSFAGTQKGKRVTITSSLCKSVECGQLVVPVTSTQNLDNTGETDNNFPLSVGQNRKCVGGRFTLIVTTNDESGNDPNFIHGFGENQVFANKKAVVNYVRKKSVLYGGQSESALANTQYFTTGHFQSIDSDFMAYLQTTNGVASGIEVYGGDTYLNMMDEGRMIKDHNSGDPQISLGLIYPVESTVNMNLREGRHLSKDRSYEPGFNPQGLSWNTPVQVENWNTFQSYSNKDAGRSYLPLPANFIPNNKFPYMSRFTETKIPGELIDTFRQFKPNNFRNVDGRFDEIMNIRGKQNRIYYWQRGAVGVIPVKERTQVSSGVGQFTTIGEGGVGTRYDERTNFYGNNHQWSLCEAEDSFIWWCSDRNCMMIANTGLELTEISALEGLISFFNNTVQGQVNLQDNPVLGNGVVSVYDSRFKRVLMTFKGMTTGPDFTVCYNMLHQHFEPRMPFAPGIIFEFKNAVYSSPSVGPTLLGSTTYNVGDTVTIGNFEFINILGLTTAPVPVPPLADPLHWQVLHSKASVYVHNKGDIAKWYEKVEKTFLRFKVVGDNELEKLFDFWHFRVDNANFFDDVTVSTNLGAGKDTDVIRFQNKEYQFRNQLWMANIPLINSGELAQGNWLEVLLEKDNRSNGSPLVSSNELIILQSVITTYRKAY